MGGEKKQSMLHEAAFLSLFSVGLQGMGLLLNIFLTRRLGAATVGALTLIGSFYGLAAVLSGGSGFVATSRFLSEEIGCGGDPQQVFRYALRFCMALSCGCAALLWIFAGQAAGKLAGSGATAWTVRLLGISLPVSAYSACLKGRCYAYRRVYLPAIAECAEFLLRACVLAFCAVFMIPAGRLSVLAAFACAMLAGQGASALFMAAMRVPHTQEHDSCSMGFGGFFRQVLPVMGNACLVALLSSANDALVPLTLLQYGDSTEQALSQFGQFEAIIIPALFFPSVVQCCMSGLLVPALSRARAEQDAAGIRRLTQRVLEQTTAFSLYVILLLVLFGREIGTLLGGDAFTGHILRIMAPVVPFIYLEIILEGVLRGLGKQNFSSLNYLAEYTVRISVLLICVPLFGFYGIVASYMACNLTGNAVRIFFVLRSAGLRPDWNRILLRPAFALVTGWQVSALVSLLLRRIRMPELLKMGIFAILCAGIYLFLLRVLDRLRPAGSKKTNCVSA